MIKETLQGKPIRHPIHPLLAHFPIGLFVFSFILDLASLLFNPAPALVLGAFYAIVLGLVMAILAAITGLTDYADIRTDHPAKQTATYHMILNLALIAVYGLNLGIRSTELDATHTAILPLILSLVGLGVLGMSGYLGGKLVFDHGISVGRHHRSTPIPGETLRVSSKTAEGKQEISNLVFIPVADENQLGEKETLRVEINGQTIALAKLDGQIFAFQDFCTHRYGPLSEGALHDGQVQCPWHRSCFDIRTGHVTHGPAKTDLKTFPVQVQSGVIRVGLPR